MLSLPKNEFTAPEIERRTMGKKWDSPNLPFKYAPRSVVDSARQQLRKGRTGDVLRYVEYAFYLYRETVNKSFFAVHYAHGNSYEWPEPVQFSWGDFEGILCAGEDIFGRIPRTEQPRVKIWVPLSGELMQESEIELETGRRRRERVRKMIPGKDNLEKVIRYNVADFNMTGVLFSMDWQNQSLADYANWMYFRLSDLENGEMAEEDVRGKLWSALDFLEKANMKVE